MSSDDANRSSLDEMEQLEELLSIQSMFELDDADAARLWRLRRSLGESVVSSLENEFEVLSAQFEGEMVDSLQMDLPDDVKTGLLQSVPDQGVDPKEEYQEFFEIENKERSQEDSRLLNSPSFRNGSFQSSPATVVNGSDSDSALSSGRSPEPNVVVKESPQYSETATERRSIHPWLGWLAAAACLVVTIGTVVNRPALDTEGVAAKERLNAIEDPNDDVAQAYAKRLYSRMELDVGSENIVRVGWKTTDGKELPGDVIWNKRKQVGVMRLASLPGDIKPEEDYQLWIFDPERKERGDKLERISGSVFRLDDRKESYLLIHSPLHLMDVSQFAITIEPKGGVVESKLEKIAALTAIKE